MRRKRKMNVVSVWIIVIFTVIAITLVSLFMLVYSFILRSEVQSTLREQVQVLRDNADTQVVDVVQNQLARRLATNDVSTGLINMLAEGHLPSVEEIRTLTNNFAQVRASIQYCERVELYFPTSGIVVGSQGVQYLNDRKYSISNPVMDYMRTLYPADNTWIRRIVPDGSTTKNVFTFLRMYPGVFQRGREPMLAVSIEEKQFLSMVRASMRTLNEDETILLIQPSGVIWSMEDTDEEAAAALVGTMLPEPDLANDSITLANGQSRLVVEAASASGAWSYALMKPSATRVSGYGALVSVWAILCVMMLFAGLGMVLRVMMKHYSQPMQRLMDNLPHNPSTGADKGWKLSSPSDHFLQLESALSDMSKLREERDYFTTYNKPLLRHAWLNCFIQGEAHYAQPQPQLEIAFPYPHFQAVITSATPADEELAVIRKVFQNKPCVMEVFESREKETVLLFNHAGDEKTLPAMLEEAGEALDDIESRLVFGVGILSPDDELVAASFRCARRALSARYFEKNQRVCVFDPAARHAEAESALSELISRLMELTSLIRRSSQEEVEYAIDSIVTQLKETTPYLSTMRSIMLLSAMFLSKVVYDMKGAPEEVYGENLLNAYYHISDISEFSQRLKLDSARLRQYLSQESSPGNRSVVQYAIHHIRNSEPADLSTHSIADAIGISTGHLSRMFHQETGRKLVDYLQEVRMEHAANLLREGVLSNEEICDRIGYSRLQYFASKFKEHYGLTLNEYRLKSQYDPESENEQ